MPPPKGFHWSVGARRDRVLQQRVNLPYRGPFFSTVSSPLLDETVAIQNFMTGTKARISTIAYPFASENAWIRGQPEVDTLIMSVIGADSRDQHPVAYFDSTKSTVSRRYSDEVTELRLNPRQTIGNIKPYRALNPGELDIASYFSQTFHGMKDVYQARGGLTHFSMTNQSANIDTALFQVRGPMFRLTSNLRDEMRFGTVRRVVPNSKTSSPTLVRSGQLSVQDPTNFAFAKEHTVIVNSLGILPAGLKLIDHRQGNVIEDDGQKGTSLATGQELRARYRWFSLFSETKAEIDQFGNWSFTTANDGTEGGRVSIPTGNFIADVGQRVDVRANGDINLTSTIGYLTASAQAGFRVTTPGIGELNGTFQLNLSSFGAITLDSAMPAGIQLGNTVGMPKYPVLIGNPTYLSTLNAVHGIQGAFAVASASYGASAAAAWSAIGGLISLIDPSGTVASLCMAAAAAGTSMSYMGSSVVPVISAHLPTLQANPAGFVSIKTISE